MHAMLKRRLRALGPVSAVPRTEALRASLGAFLALFLTALVAISPHAAEFGFFLLAPFGASAVLLFAAVSSPLAQPWPVVMGNTISAVVAIAVCNLITIPLLAVPLSVAGAILAMAILRATHPPGGAMALTVALASAKGATPELLFALTPVAVVSILLVLAAMLWARLTGRKYPMRQFGAPGPVLTADPPAAERLGLNEVELRDLLSEYRQSLNLGVEDLARLIAAAEMKAASHQTGPKTTAEIMSRDLVTLSPQSPLPEIAKLFDRHGFTSLPVVDHGGLLLGVIFQRHVIAALARSHAEHSTPLQVSAADIMTTRTFSVTEATPIGQLVSPLAEKGIDAVMVLEGQVLTGVVTQTDLLTALARELLHHAAPARN